MVFILSNYISFLASCCGVRCDFRVNTLIYFVGASCFICVVCIYLRIMMLVLLSSNTMNVTSGAETALPNPEFTSVLVDFLLLNHQVSVQCFVDHCLSFCHFPPATLVSIVLITPLVSSNVPYASDSYAYVFVKFVILGHKTKYDYSFV